VAFAGASRVRAVAADLRELGFRAYCPLGRRVIHRARGPYGKRERRVEQYPVFGGYLFVGEVKEPLTREMDYRIVDILRMGFERLTVPAQAIRDINDAEIAGEWDGTKAAPTFALGRRVKVNIGRDHLAEFFGIVQGIEKSGKIRVSAYLFGHHTTILVNEEKLSLEAA
jgi:hypothetical protein